ncbi:MAG: hypothetical protein C5B50_25190 [Verrucomicrobia bacterium]|nr:MAG: hypothetical protein C5B50_25190 [Verrucomicrobiota bacterium]
MSIRGLSASPSTLDFGLWTLDFGLRISDFGFRIFDPCFLESSNTARLFCGKRVPSSRRSPLRSAS